MPSSYLHSNFEIKQFSAVAFTGLQIGVFILRLCVERTQRLTCLRTSGTGHLYDVIKAALQSFCVFVSRPHTMLNYTSKNSTTRAGDKSLSNFRWRCYILFCCVKHHFIRFTNFRVLLTTKADYPLFARPIYEIDIMSTSCADRHQQVIRESSWYCWYSLKAFKSLL